ncbi:UvrD-helicase domain-containing protein [bacterium]|nr:UvrD-helicase domain-containing protein [bacterium]
MSIDLKKVFDLNRNVFIEACAGAGKTWLLSKRYAAIMDDFARQQAENPQSPLQDASNILVITFTRKAAAEMSGRIYADLNLLLNDQPLAHVPADFGSYLRQAPQSYKMHLRSTYSRNAISTIDSFCTQILRDQAENLNIDPEFRIQDEADTQRMEMETWESFLRNRSHNQDPDLKFLLEHLSVYHLSEYVKKLQTHSQLMMPWLEYQASHSPEELQSEFRKAHSLPSVLEKVERQLIDLVDNLPNASEMINPDHAQYRKLADLVAFLSSLIEDDYVYGLELLELVRRIALISSREKYYSSISIPSNVWPTQWVGVIRERYKSFISEIQDLLPYDMLMGEIPGKWDLDACTVQHHLSRFFLAYLEVLNQRLQREGVLSFNEVILQTRKVLENPKIAAYYGNRFSHILFDEFQDTNDLRWDIIRLIAQGKSHKLRDRGLFIVGDIKQSIYRFNQADVQVMNRVRKTLSDARAWILSADETYRSSRKFVNTVINPLISATFPDADEQADLALYETAFRPTLAAENNPPMDGKHEISRCMLSVVLEDDKSGGSAIDVIHTADLCQDWLTWIENQGIETGPGPAVGILLRSFTHILDYIRVFTAKGLDFEVLSSKGLFAQQESYDIYHLLSVLINPLDDLALVGILRSPFFIIIDSDIQKLRELASNGPRTGWVWSSLSHLQPEIFEEIQAWRKDSAREPLDRLITNIMSGADRRLGWISETGGALRLANLERLIHMIHQLSLDGLGLREIQEYFKFQIQHGEASQAELPGATRIQILSIHKSKGLEFPVVILPNLQAPPKSETSGIYIGRAGEQWQAGITVDTFNASHKTLMFQKIKANTKAEEEAEDKRLFYVALTRARYGVGFVARIDTKRQPWANTWWRRYLMPVFDLELDKEQALTDPQSIQKSWQERSSSEMFFDLTLGSEILAKKSFSPPVVDQEIMSQASFGVPQIYEEISPHTIMVWMDKKHYAGSDEQKTGEDRDLETTALTFGRLLHRAMELEWFDSTLYAEPIQHYLEEEGVVDPENQKLFQEDLTECLTLYRQSSLSQKIAALSGIDKFPEIPVFGYLKSMSRVFKVSGIIDLLYLDGDDWVVLDYKTDKELPPNLELKDYAYWYQIQTYLWILKLLYGIEARGELYFNRFDKIITIEYEPELYFSKLATLDHGQGLQPILPSGTDIEAELLDILKKLDPHKPVVIIEPTKNSSERLIQAMTLSELNHPRLQVLTLNDFRKLTEPVGRRLTPYLSRLGVARLLGKRPQWGMVNRIAAAFYKATRGEVVTPDKQELFHRFLVWCTEHKIMTSGKEWEFSKLLPELKIIVNSIHSTTPSDYMFLADLGAERDLIFIDPLSPGKPVSGFPMTIKAWMTQEEMPSQEFRHSYTPCFAIHEELVLVASKIRNMLQGGTAPGDILIAVSSMERYVPTLKRVFDQVGISVRVSKREPVMERPVTQLALALIQGRIAHLLSWDMAMSVWLHPLVIPSGTPGNTRMKLDIEARKLGITTLDKSLPDRFSHPRINQAAKDLLKFVTKEWHQDRNSGLVQEAKWLASILGRFQFTHRLKPGSVASKAYTSLKNAIIGIRVDWERYLSQKGSLRDLNRELRERLKGVEVSSAQQGFGVDVISLLDTLNLTCPHLFVIGLTEGQFPIAPDSNPYLKQSELNPWFLNLYLFKHWLARPQGSLHLTSPLRNADGTPLQESTFCQYLNKQEYPKLPPISRQAQLAQMAGKTFARTHSKIQDRHNELLLNAGTGDWYGKLASHAESSFDQISASAFDDLIKCPQRFWYSRKLYLEPAETNIAERQEIEVGNLVHKVLEIFGNQEGFILAATDLSAALEKLESVALSFLKEQEIDPDADLLDNKWSELYFKNFLDPDRNLLAAMLNSETMVLDKFGDPGLHEQAFGDINDEQSWPAVVIENESLKLALRGKIDRVFIEGDNVWATDYKTGHVDIKQSREFWTSQMLFYYLMLKTRFPEKNVVLTYEQVKDFKENKFGFKGYLGDVSSDNPVMETLPPRSKAIIPIADGEEWSVERIKSETLSYARYLADNVFPLTKRDESIACAYCPYDRICRKTALPR